MTTEQAMGHRTMTATEAMEKRDAIDRGLEARRSRRSVLIGRQTTVRARSEGLAAEIAAAMVEDVEGKSLTAPRRERLALSQEAEELALAITSLDEQIAALGGRRERALRRLVAATALAQVDHVADLAERVDEIWAPAIERTEHLLVAERDSASCLSPLFPHRTYDARRRALTRVLLWRLGDLLEGIPRAEAAERVSVREFLDDPRTRAELEQMLREEETP